MPNTTPHTTRQLDATCPACAGAASPFAATPFEQVPPGEWIAGLLNKLLVYAARPITDDETPSEKIDQRHAARSAAKLIATFCSPVGNYGHPAVDVRALPVGVEPQITEDVALALSDLQRASRSVGELAYRPGEKRAEAEEAEARAECEREILDSIRTHLRLAASARPQGAEDAGDAIRTELRAITNAAPEHNANTCPVCAEGGWLGAPNGHVVCRSTLAVTLARVRDLLARPTATPDGPDA